MSDRENSRTLRPNEHDRVRVKDEKEPGTVVHIFPHHLAYLVEFDHRVEFVDYYDIEEVVWRSKWLETQ